MRTRGTETLKRAKEAMLDFDCERKYDKRWQDDDGGAQSRLQSTIVS